eukprot:1193357-Prorocentrum_minimum.AAC.1
MITARGGGGAVATSTAAVPLTTLRGESITSSSTRYERSARRECSGRNRLSVSAWLACAVSATSRVVDAPSPLASSSNILQVTLVGVPAHPCVIVDVTPVVVVKAPATMFGADDCIVPPTALEAAMLTSS